MLYFVLTKKCLGIETFFNKDSIFHIFANIFETMRDIEKMLNLKYIIIFNIIVSNIMIKNVYIIFNIFICFI